MRYALVPVKDLTQAKVRLAPLLSAAERLELARAMLDDVVLALRLASGFDRLAMVTTDTYAVSMAPKWGFEVVNEGEARGETGAVELAIRACVKRGARSLAVIPGDIPLVTPQDIDMVTDLGKDYDAVIVPSWDSRGTNAILMRPANALELRFGSWSFFPHVRQAKGKGLSYKIARLPRVALDIDTPQDLARLLPQAGGTRSFAVLDKMKISLRLRKHKIPVP
jgi:2-phospho-L-lactate guanylyltransferase